MKKVLCIILAVLMSITLASCGAAPKQNIVVFKDSVLESMIRKAMYKPEGDITLAEAEMVTELKLGIEWQQHIPEETQIKDISGLEAFKNLTSLDLSFHAVTDISPLAGLSKLTLLSLGGNPITDIKPLSGLTNLSWLTLFNCQAEDYSPLSNLTNLDALMLDHSSIRDISCLSGLTKLQKISLTNTQVSDITPLAGLTGLKSLKLEACNVTDYSPLKNIYQNLEEKDFTAAFTLAQLGFTMDSGSKQAIYDGESASVRINHTEWGAPSEDWMKNCIRTVFEQNGYKIDIGYFPDSDTYVMAANKDRNLAIKYEYDHAKDSFAFGIGDSKSSEQVVRAIFTNVNAENVLLTPIQVFKDTLNEMFGVDADELYALPFDDPTLLNLGFVPDKANAVCIYEQHEGKYTSIEVHYPEWGEKDYDLRFFTQVNDYGLVITYYKEEQRFYVAADKGDTYAKFNFLVSDNKWIDENASGNMAVEDYLINMFNDPNIKDVHLYCVSIAQQYITDKFGMSIDELCSLPLGE